MHIMYTFTYPLIHTHTQQFSSTPYVCTERTIWWSQKTRTAAKYRKKIINIRRQYQLAASLSLFNLFGNGHNLSHTSHNLLLLRFLYHQKKYNKMYRKKRKSVAQMNRIITNHNALNELIFTKRFRYSLKSAAIPCYTSALMSLVAWMMPI